MTIRTLVIRYAFFAALATLANLAVQRAVLLGGTTGTYFVLALAAGTFTGLVTKYLLDQRWIFYEISTDLRSNGRKFTLYSLTGLITTAIFWGTETLFWFTWQTNASRELGAILGLTVGYILKYNLDYRFVFTNAPLDSRRIT